MKILMVGPPENNATDGVIIKGIKYLLSRSFKDYTIDYVEIDDHKYMLVEDLRPLTDYDLIVVSGTPWLWDSFQDSVKFANLMLIFSVHPEAKRLFMGIGSCLNLKDITFDILKRPLEVAAIQAMLKDATVITRDHLAYHRVTNAGIQAHNLPCPAYFCYGDEAPSQDKYYNVLVFQDPTKSISAGDWQDQAKLHEYYQGMLRFYHKHNPKVVCAKDDDRLEAYKQGYSYTSLSTADDTLRLMRHAHQVYSGRIHCAVPAIAQGARVYAAPLDTRHYVISDYEHLDVQSLLNFKLDYDNILTGIKFSK